MIEEVKKILEKYETYPIRSLIADEAQEICQLFEPKPDEGRLLTDEEIREAIRLTKEECRELNNRTEVFKPKEFKGLFHNEEHDKIIKGKIAKAQDAKTARILTRVPDEGISPYELPSAAYDKHFTPPDEGLGNEIAEWLCRDRRGIWKGFEEHWLTKANQILTKFKNYVELDQRLPEPSKHLSLMDNVDAYELAQKDMIDDGWKKILRRAKGVG